MEASIVLLRTCLPVFVAVSFAVLSPTWGFAKGVGDLKPKSDDAGKVEPEAAAAPEAEAEDASPPVEPSTTPQEAAPEPPSALSLALADKLTLGTGLALVVASPPSGTLATRGAGEFFLRYVLPANILSGLDLLGSFRYLPISGVAVVDGQSFRTSYEALNFGAVGRYRLQGVAADPALLASFEVGYVLVHAASLDGLELASDASENGVAVTVGTGADWMVLPKFLLGPRLYFGFGRLSVVQVSGAAGFVF